MGYAQKDCGTIRELLEPGGPTKGKEYAPVTRPLTGEYLGYERAGEYKEALAAFSRATASGGSTKLILSQIGYTYAASGHVEEAERTIAELRALSEKSYVPPYYMARIHKGLGHTAEALTWLETAYNEKDIQMVFLGLDSHWDSLRGNPRFVRLMDRMNLSK